MPGDPFAAPVASQPPPAKKAAEDPFSSAGAQAPAGEVRLVIDDKSDVTAEEIGRKSASKMIVAAIAAAIAGVVIGWMVGGTARERSLYNLVLHDAQEIYKTVDGATGTVNKAHSLINKAVKAAAPGPGKEASPDFASIKELRGLEKPFTASSFSQKHYRAFSPGTVDALFSYYNNVNLIWDKIQSLAGHSLSPTAQKALTGSAKAATDFAKLQYGCVPFKTGEQFGCGMVQAEAGEQPGMIKVSSMGRSFEKAVFAGQDLSGKTTSNFVILIDKGRSKEFLGGGANKFQHYARSLMELKTLMDTTIETQGRLIRELGDVAKLQSL